MKKNKYISLVSTAIALGLAACGDDITNEEIVQQVASVGSVKTKKDLPDCADAISGQTAYVQNDSSFYGCNGENWIKLNNNTVSVGDNTCTSEQLKSNDGFKIICNGIVIGTVHDGQEGEPGEPGKPGNPGKNGASCSIVSDTTQVPNDLKVTITCGGETISLDLSEKNVPLITEDCEEGSEECIPLDSVKLNGVSQKGPFVKGANVTAYELSDGKTLKQTGNNFNGTIESDKGLFNIKTVKLSSQYAYLVAEGFYRNEVTGNPSSAPIKLRALTNLHGRNKANINLVTHLEFDRVTDLVTKNGMKVLEAKKQAEKEIFDAFGINVSKFDAATQKLYAEDFNILSEGDGNAALLAISLLLQGNRSEAQLTALLASLSLDIGDDGVWGNLSDRAKIADWAMSKDLSAEGLNQFREKINGWKSVEGMEDIHVPAFEKYVRNFWMKELDVPECTVNGRIMNIGNSYSDFYAENALAINKNTDKNSARLICDNGDWRFATDIEKDVGLDVHENGYATIGRINSDFVYVYEKGNWRYGTELDLDKNLGSCIEGKVGTIKQSVNNEWYTCAFADTTINSLKVETLWHKASAAEILSKDWNPGLDGECRTYNRERYAYDSLKGIWREPVFPECQEYGIDVCTHKRALENATGLSHYDSKAYVCTSNGWIEGDAMLNDTITWSYEYSGPGSSCYTTESGNIFAGSSAPTSHFEVGELIPGRVNSANKFVCDNNKFRLATEQEVIMERGCTSFNLDSVYTNLIADVKCTENGWVPHYGTVKSSANITYKTIRIGNLVWFAENMRDNVSGSYCYTYNGSSTCPTYGRTYTFGAAMGIYNCKVSTYESGGYAGFKNCPTTTPVRGICPIGWRLPSAKDFNELYLLNRIGNRWIAEPYGTDAYGLSILLGGRYDRKNQRGTTSSSFYGVGEETAFWASDMKWDEYAYPQLTPTASKLNVSCNTLLDACYVNMGDEVYDRITNIGSYNPEAYVRCVKDVP